MNYTDKTKKYSADKIAFLCLFVLSIIIARFISQALRGEPLTIYDNGQQTRCFTYVTDTATGTIRAATLPQAVGQVFNIGSDHETSVNELAQTIIRITDSTSEIRYVPYKEAYGPAFEETRRRVPDTTRARELLDFTAQVPLEQDLKQTVTWFQESNND